VRLPSCPATQILRDQFGIGSDTDLVGEWVSFAAGTPDRTELFGLRGINRVVKNYYVRFIPDELLCIDGQFRLENGHKIIYIKPGISIKRLRFTIAHELGHVAFHVLAPGFDQNAEGVERLCDIFAAELMMPIRMVQELGKTFRGSEVVLALSKMAGASLPASCIRVNECLGITSGLATLDGDVLENYGYLPSKLNPSKELVAGIKAAAQDRCGLVSVKDWLVDVSISGNMAIYTASRLPAAA